MSWLMNSKNVDAQWTIGHWHAPRADPAPGQALSAA
jgi:hypothetical protein